MQRNDIEIKEVQFENAVLLPEIVKMLNEGHTVTLRLKGVSMRPFLEDNRDKALLKAVDRLRIYDPVLAEIQPGRYVLHRLIRLEGDQATLLGDGNLNVERCKKEDIKGIAVGFYRKGHTELDSIESNKWKIYSYLWMKLLPIRRYLLAFHRRIWLKIFPSKANK